MTITDDQIMNLISEADLAGDYEMVAIATIALYGRPGPGWQGPPSVRVAASGLVLGQAEARGECARVIADARAQ